MESKKRRIFDPTVIETKQELLVALRSGELRVSKYNALNDNQKMFVELVIFGGYSGEQAVRVIDPKIRAPLSVANRLMADPTVQSVFEELTQARDKKFRSEAMNARDVALRKLQYIMQTSKDEGLQLAAAKTILEKTNDYLKANDGKDKPDGVTRVQYNIKVDSMNVNPGPVGAVSRQHEPIIIPIDEEPRQEAQALLEGTTNPENGMPYTLVYEGVNNYGGESQEESSRREEVPSGEVSDVQRGDELSGGMEGEVGSEGLDDISSSGDEGTDEGEDW